MRVTSLLPLLLLLTAAPAAGPALAQSDELERAWTTLQEAAAADAAAEEKRLAERALPALLARLESGEARCEDVFLAGEAQVRAGRPLETLSTLERAEKMACSEADRLQLRAWALEFGTDGTRRGPGAQLRAAEEAWFRAAHLLREAPQPDPAAIAGAIGNAAELALLRGAHDKAFERALAGLRIAPTQPQQEALALTLVRAGSPLHGEGASLDLVAEVVDQAALVRITDVRLQGLRTELDARRHDPDVLAAVSFYALLAGTEYELYNALRYLREAVGLKPDLPDGWYLLGRTHEARGELEAARQAWTRQVENRPEAPATRLAVNSLAWLEAEVLSSRENGEKALALLDAEIEKTPREAAFHETRARLLDALGRSAEACEAANAALLLYEDEESRGDVLRWKSAKNC